MSVILLVLGWLDVVLPVSNAASIRPSATLQVSNRQLLAVEFLAPAGCLPACQQLASAVFEVTSFTLCQSISSDQSLTSECA